MDQWIREQYKNKGGFGMTTLENRRSASLVNRKEQRNNMLTRFRNIPENMSPLMSPMVSKRKVNEDKKQAVQKTVSGNNKRIEMLKKWKEEKEKKKLEAKRKAKPPFKVFHVEHKENLDDIYKNIKGKSISQGKTPTKSNFPNKIFGSKLKLNEPLMINKNNDSLISQPQRVATSKSVPHKKVQSAKPESLNAKPTKVHSALSKNKLKVDSSSAQIKKGERASNRNRTNVVGVKEDQPNNLVNSKRENTRSNWVDLKSKSEIDNPNEQQSSKSSKKNLIVTKNNSPELKPKKRSTRKSKSKELSDKKNDLSEVAEIADLDNRETEIDTTDGQEEVDKNDEKKIRKGKRSMRKNDEKTKLMRQLAVESSDLDNTIENENKEPITRSTRGRGSGKDINEEVSTPVKTSRKKRKSLESPLRKSNSSRKSKGSTTETTSEDAAAAVTPQEQQVDDICYVSPFVTVSRGKVAARREFEQRKSLNGSLFNASISGSTDPRSPKAAADYFTRKLENEIERIQNMCKIWQDYKGEANLSEDACGLIDMTIGQSNLLITKKFNQFRGLIQRCKSNDEIDMKIKCEDLHGFWDMMYKQVTDLEKRFENLEDMKKNNWLEEVPKVKTPKVPAKEKKRGRPKKASKATSSLKETILAARKNRLKQLKSEGDIEIMIAGKEATPSRRSRGREVPTPGRGILKSSAVKSEKRKTVVFQNVRDSLGNGNDSSSSSRVLKGTPIPSRRSSRLSLNRSKLVFE